MRTFANSHDAKLAVVRWAVGLCAESPADFSIETTDMREDGMYVVFSVTACGQKFDGRFPLLSMIDAGTVH